MISKLRQHIKELSPTTFVTYGIALAVLSVCSCQNPKPKAESEAVSLVKAPQVQLKELPAFTRAGLASELQIENASTIQGRLLETDGTPYSGTVRIKYSQDYESNEGHTYRSMGPHDVQVVAGEFKTTIASSYFHRGLPVEIAIRPRGSEWWTSDHEVWLNPYDERQVLERRTLQLHQKGERVVLDLGEVQFQPAPLFGTVEATGIDRETGIRIAALEIVSRSNTDFFQDQDSTFFTIQPGVHLSLYSWSKREKFTVWKTTVANSQTGASKGAAPVVFERGAHAVFAVVNMNGVTLELAEGDFPKMASACAFPAADYVPLPTPEESASRRLVLGGYLRVQMSPYQGWLTSAPPCNGIGFSDLPDGDYVFEIWGGRAASESGPFTTRVLKLEGGKPHRFQVDLAAGTSQDL